MTRETDHERLLSLFTKQYQAQFIVPLAQPYELVGEWEVGLMEIQYATTWYNVPSDQFVQVGNTTTLIPEGIYADIKELIKILNKKK